MYAHSVNARNTYNSRRFASALLGAKIPFGYNELVSAIGDAIEEQANKDGAVLVDNVSAGAKMEERSYEDIRAEAFELWKALIEQDEENAARVLKRLR